jgi:RNA polymerase sigma-70 factor (ECF subfamily)
MQQVFRLSRLEGLTHDQIAQKMQISKATSQSYIVRALVLIRKHLAENNYPLGPLSFYLLLKLARIF